MYKSSSRGGAKIRLVALHAAEGSRTAASLGAYFYDPDVMASSHVGIDAGHTLRYVADSRAAWTLRSGNPISLNAEMCAFTRWTRAQWLSTAAVDGCLNPRAIVRRAAAWAKQACRDHGIPIRMLTPAQVAAGQAGIIDHYDWTVGMHDGTHSDVGKGFPWDVFIQDINAGSTSVPPRQEDDDVRLDDKVKAVLSDGQPHDVSVADVLAGMAQYISGNSGAKPPYTSHPAGQYWSRIVSIGDLADDEAKVIAAIRGIDLGEGITPEEHAAALKAALPAAVLEALVRLGAGGQKP